MEKNTVSRGRPGLKPFRVSYTVIYFVSAVCMFTLMFFVCKCAKLVAINYTNQVRKMKLSYG